MKEDDLIRIRISGSGFLYNMVRIIAGTLMKIGGGQWKPDRMRRIIAACDRQEAGPTAPPEGLCLMEIELEDPPFEY
jgi:tRNA pseudouridine38-40 synthase